MILCCSQSTLPQGFRPEPSLGYRAYEHDSGDWGGIYFKERGGTKRLVLQIYDLKFCSMDFLLFGIRTMGTWDGLYNPDTVNPYFDKIDRDSAYALYKTMYDDKVISMTNGAFFEAPTETSYTKLAYPLQYGGVLLASGGSPFGPRAGKYPLQVLQANDSSVEIRDYDYTNGSTMRNAAFPNQVATLNYLNHPNIKEFPGIAGGYKTRYHLLTALDCDTTPGNETIVILSSNYDLSICELAAELKRLHPSITDGHILTLDGGSSISLKDRRGSDIIAPERGVKVPMYFGFRLRGKEPMNAPKIMNPRRGEVVHAGHPYYIFYSSKDEIAQFMLYQDDTLQGTLDDIGVAFHRGLFVWNPSGCKPGAHYQVKLRSASAYETRSEYFIVDK